jgi:uncharacterized membrane protein HdeD (DUF308 family)
MEIQKPSSATDRDKDVLKWQYRVVFATILLFVPVSYLSYLIFHALKYGLLIACVGASYLAVSSIKNRISIFNSRRGKGPSKGWGAVSFGILLIIFEIAWLIFIFTPSLSDKYLNF